MGITKRATKGSPLTHDEVDQNFQYLDDKLGTDGNDGAPGIDGQSVEVFVDLIDNGNLTRIDYDTDLNTATFVFNAGTFTIATL